MKVLLDTNIWISALLFGGNPRKVINLAQEEKIQLYSSEALFQEFSATLEYPKLKKRLTQLRLTPDEVLLAVQKIITLCEPAPLSTVEGLRDVDDLVVLATALASGVSAIVSGDQDLRVLEQFAGIYIMTASEFLDSYFPDV
jgi:hypothetical protein